MRAMANQVPVGGAVRVTKYFKATNTVTEEAKVTLAMMHMCEDVKLWWRSRYMDIQEGRCTIDTWDILKKELRLQFFPENVEILARRKLRDLKHNSNIRENRNSCLSSPKDVGGGKNFGLFNSNSDDNSNQVKGEVDQIEVGGKT
ncbi:9-cis-epoxycarotenoid dioxygenase NCED6 [Cucumis melo var. makuwa]|uniref:9-cis-epoxycarotenoid dioxygenase NCED6 n=1 Tax=Cucumis melo var. makuwa TaxID=1194695 RepID=A0A5D3CGQ6_CUCMM|nr:9-cis-epoxycarotenoid dioxygenase NCED6 [Cucumis melo var. makuwa]